MSEDEHFGEFLQRAYLSIKHINTLNKLGLSETTQLTCSFSLLAKIMVEMQRGKTDAAEAIMRKLFPDS
jgi:hypothetical protein